MDYEVHWDEYIIDVQIEHPRLRAWYTRLQQNSRQLAFAAIGIGLLTCAIPVISIISCVADAAAFVWIFMSITRVVTDDGSVTTATATSLEASETVE